MRFRVRVLVPFIFFVSHLGYGFIPPVASLIKDFMEGRKPAAGIEVSVLHRIRTTVEGEAVVLKEKLLRDRNQILLFVQTPDSETPWVGIWNGKEYRFVGVPPFLSESKLFLRTLMASTPDEMISALIAEQFLRKDQLLQYKPGFEFEGDPTYWKIQDNYLNHPDIFLKRLGENVFYSFSSFSDGKNRRTFFMDRTARGLARLEWQSESGVTAWNFQGHTSRPYAGSFPSRLAFETSGLTLIESEIEYFKVLNADQIKSARRAFEQAAKKPTPIPEGVHSALKILLSFR